ncbi:MAG: phosphotransferase [Planctomycetota bacterium]
MAEIAYDLDSWFPVLRGGEAPRELFDAQDPRTATRLLEAWSALEDGGRLVLRSAGTQSSRVDARELETNLEADGEVERFLEFPGPRGSALLLPTADAAAFRGGMVLLPGGRARNRTVWTLLRAASPFVLAQGLGRPEVAVWTKGASRREAEDLPALPVDGSLAVTTGDRARSRPTVVRALDRRGAARAVLKIGLSERTDDGVAREARALEQLAELAPDRAPRLLADGERAGRTWLAQEVLEGRHAGEAFGHRHAAFLSELAERTRGETELAEAGFWTDAKRHLATLDPLEDPDWHAEYHRLAEAVERSSDDRPIPTALAHGDFAPWNLLIRRGDVRAHDWGHLTEDAPGLHDVLHFHVQAGVIAKDQPGERIYEDLDRLFAGPAQRVVQALELERDDVLRLTALYVLHEGTTTEVVRRKQDASDADGARLRHALRALCRRLAGLLGERTLPAWTRVDRTGPRKAA